MLIFSPTVPLPPGYRFTPTKTEILCSYLRPAINGKPLPSKTLIEREIYGENKEPWNVFRDNKRSCFWVFTKLVKKSKSRIDRTAGSGTWLGRNVKEVRDEHGQLLGFDKYFTFTCKKDESSQGRNGNWIMHEFSLIDQDLSDYVICEIRNKDAVDLDDDVDEEDDSTSAKEPINQKRKAIELDNDEESMSVPTVKNMCVGESNANQDNAEWINGSSLPNNQENIFGEIEDQENHDPNKLWMDDVDFLDASEWNDTDLASLLNELEGNCI
ncbi:hypothetical protein DITRI_Ditri04bG0039900 [Diplodiscus trichospermus]